MNVIELKNIAVEYEGEYLFENLNIDFKEGKFYTLLGPSGCGKTTILNLIAGFKKATAGTISLGGKDVTNLDANKRMVNTVFQNYALFPHLNVYENVAFGLRLQKKKETEIKELVDEYLTLVNLNGYQNRNISELSGGQKQRVAIARALINDPKVLLLDEPLSALDLKLRTEMQYVLKEIQERLKITFIFVTHDQEEALALSDYIYVMNKGKIEQLGEPKDIYDEPNNRFVADFIGESNIIEAKYQNPLIVEVDEHQFACVDSGFADGEKVDIVIRPEDITIDHEHGKLQVEIISNIFRGMNYELLARDIANNHWLIHTIKNFEVGEHVYINFEAEDIHVMKAGCDEK